MQSGWLQQSRREFLRGAAAVGVAAGMAAGSSSVVESATNQAQAQDTPLGTPWWPSRWGPDDEAGASNWITPEKVLDAARLIRTGKI
jgi:hypothetical protein